MHIEEARRQYNLIAAWAVAVTDVVRATVEKSTGMAGSGPAALVAIVAEPGLSIDELRRVLGLTHPGAVRLVDRLADRGWILRQHGIGRTLRLVPTAAGRRAERRLAAAREEAVAALLASMPKGDVRTVAGLIEPVLAANINDVDAIRRLCRLCNRDVCGECPAEVRRA
jgi:DNA-binding MarR family transcriptional regulator